jgi:hypothetical protein
MLKGAQIGISKGRGKETDSVRLSGDYTFTNAHSEAKLSKFIVI